MTILAPENLSSVLAVLTALIAPALLVSACGTFISSTSTRMTLSIERVRLLVARLRELRDRELDEAAQRERDRLRREMSLTFRRVILQQRALGCFYAAAALFVACSLALGLEAVTTFVPPLMPVALGLAGVAMLLVGCALLVVDVHRLVNVMKEEITAAHEHV